MFWRVSVPAFALVLGTLCVPFTYADDEAVIEEIVVTAQKRSQNLQEVPIAITAFSETMIERSGGNKTQAAELLGMKRTTLVEKARRIGRELSGR